MNLLIIFLIVVILVGVLSYYERKDEEDKYKAKSLSDYILRIDTEEGKKRLEEHLESLPFPHFKADPDGSDLIIKIEKDGSKTLGKFVDREWVIVKIL